MIPALRGEAGGMLAPQDHPGYTLSSRLVGLQCETTHQEKEKKNKKIKSWCGAIPDRQRINLRLALNMSLYVTNQNQKNTDVLQDIGLDKVFYT